MTVLITGANRGLGFGLTEAYLQDGETVHACCRAPEKAEKLTALADAHEGRLHIHQLDMEDRDAIDALAHHLEGVAIDILLNNAGYYGTVTFGNGGLDAQDFGQSDFEDWEKAFRINCIAPMKMAEQFIQHVAASQQKKIVTLTSIVASIGSSGIGKMYGYRAGKTAANGIMHAMGLDLKERGIIAIPMHPGFAKTDMGGANAAIEPEEAVTGIKSVIAGLTLDHAGKFMAYTGEELPW